MSRALTTGRRLFVAGVVLLCILALFLRWDTAQRNGTPPSPSATQAIQDALPVVPVTAALEPEVEKGRPGPGPAAVAPGEVLSQVPGKEQRAGDKEQERVPKRLPTGLGSLRIEVLDAFGGAVSAPEVRIHRGEFCAEQPYSWSSFHSGTSNEPHFEDLLPGVWHVVVKAPGQKHVETMVMAENETRVRVQIDTGLVIAGEVLHPEDINPSDLCVTAVSEIGCGTVQGEIDEDGRFRVEGLCVGSWRCYAGSRKWGRVTPGVGWGMHAALDSVPIANSELILVTESREDLRLILRRPSIVSGRITGSNISPKTGVAINRDTGHRYGLRFNDEGFSAVGLDPGSYMIMCRNAEGWGVKDEIKVAEGSVVTDLVVAIEPPALLDIALPPEAGRPQDGRVRLFRNGVLLPFVSGNTYEVPAGEIDLEVRSGGSHLLRTVEAIAGQTVEVFF